MKFRQVLECGSAVPLLVGMLTAFIPVSASARVASSIRDEVQSQINQNYPTLLDLYKHLHTHPELSFQEEKTSARIAEEIQKAGYEVTSKCARYARGRPFQRFPSPQSKRVSPP